MNTALECQRFDVRRSPATYGTLLKAYGQKLDLQSVLRVWHDMKAADLGVNTVTYGCTELLRPTRLNVRTCAKNVLRIQSM